MHLVESANISMDLNTIKEVAHPQKREQLPVWTAGDAWLAGGTFLFSEPQAHLTRLIDLTDLKWPALTISETGLTIAATCPGAQLAPLACPPEWLAPRRRRQSLHVAPGRPDDLADGGARRRLHGLESRWQRATHRRRRLRHRQPTQHPSAWRSAPANRHFAGCAEAP